MSPGTPTKPYYPEIDDPPEPFDVEAHQEENFRAGGRRDDLWNYLEGFELFDYLSNLKGEGIR